MLNSITGIPRRVLYRMPLVSTLVLGFTLSGCFQKSDPWETTHPAIGEILYKGKPIADAEISFFPEDASFPDTIRPKAKSTKDGTFVVWTNEQGDGAPEGDYKVTVVHHEVAISKDTIVAKPNDLPAKYSKKDTTDLTVRISKGKNHIPSLELR